MGFPLILALRAVQAVFAIIILGLSAYVANWYNVDTLTSSPSQVNFLVFVPLFSLISIAYLEAVPKFMPKFHHPWAVLALETTNVIFYFAGFIALAVFLSKLLFCRGAVCGSARAATAFSSFEFALWAATAALTIKDAAQGGFSGIRLPGRNRGPSQATMQFQQGQQQQQQQMKEAAMAAGSFYGFDPAPVERRPSDIEMVVSKMSAGWSRRSTLVSTAESEEWEIGTFVGSEEDVVAGKWGRRDTL